MALIVTHSLRQPLGSSGAANISYRLADSTVIIPWKIITDNSDRTINGGQVATWTGTPTVEGEAKPVVGDLLDSTSGMVLKTIDPQQDSQNPNVWMLTLNYGYITAETSGGGSGGGGGFGEINPVLRPPIVQGHTMERQKAIESLPGNGPGNERPLLWSNGRPMVPLPELTEYLPTLYVQQFENGFSRAAASPVLGSVNSTTFVGFPAKTVICTKLDGDLVFWQDGQTQRTCAQVTYQFIHNRDGWSPMRILSRDFFEKANNNTVRPIVINGAFVQEPHPLDVNGFAVPVSKIADGTADDQIGSAENFHYTNIDLPEFDFNLLPLPFQYL